MTAQFISRLYKEFRLSTGICTDTRKLQAGSLFVALSGENFDGNNYAEEALSSGCRAVLTERRDLEGKAGFLVVDSTLDALQELARYHRHQVNPGVLGITGSNGKTTTKELCAAILGRKFRVLATRGNLNNHIGVPLTLLSLNDEEMAVIEMGANHLGEIASLAAMANPGLGLITNVGKAHLEGFGSLGGVLKAKGELYEQLASTGGEAIIDGQDELLLGRAREAGVDQLRVGPGLELPVDARLISGFPTLKLELQLGDAVFEVESALVGDYNLQNIRLAAAVGMHLGVDPGDIAGAIGDYRPVNRRSQLVEGRRNRLIMDSYNANPSSMRDALSSLISYSDGPRMAILGDMAELGADSDKEHRELGIWLEGTGVDKVLLLGPNFDKNCEPSERVTVFRDRAELEDWIREEQPEGFTILVKGSRIMALEHLEALLI